MSVIARIDEVDARIRQRVVLRELLSLDIDEGAITCIIGLSGAGKSTILRLLNGLRKPDSGHVYVRGTDICCMRTRRARRPPPRIGFAFQFAALFDSMSRHGQRRAAAARTHDDV